MSRPLRTIENVETPEALGQTVERMLKGGTRLWRVYQPLPYLANANVYLYVEDAVATNSLVVRGLARYDDGHISGERHEQSIVSSDSQPAHDDHGPGCGGFRLLGNGLFAPSELSEELYGTGEEGRQIAWNQALDIVGGLIDPDPAGDVLSDDTNTAALRWMRALNATNALFVDPALDAALNEQLLIAGV